MLNSEMIARTAVKGDEEFFHNTLTMHGCYVALHGTPINYFSEEKHAKSFIQHTYGRSAWDARSMGVSIQPLNDKIVPGGKVVYDGNGQFDSMSPITDMNGKDIRVKAGFGVVCGSFRLALYNKSDTVPFVCFNASAPYYDEHGVHTSGGPVPSYLKNSEFKVVGLTEMTFWRFADIPIQHGGGYFRLQVPLYRWTGNKN